MTNQIQWIEPYHDPVFYVIVGLILFAFFAGLAMGWNLARLRIARRDGAENGRAKD